MLLEKPNVTPNYTRTQDGHGKDKAEVARLTDILATGATGDSTRKEYNGRIRTFSNIRAARGKGPWLLERDGVEEAARELTTFIHVLIDISFVRIRAKRYLLRTAPSSQWKKGLIGFRVM